MNDPIDLNRYFSSGWDPGLPPLNLVRRRRQRTLRIRIRDDVIIVSGPASVSRSRMMRFVGEKREWILKVCRRRMEKAGKLAEKRKQAEGTILLRGIRKPLLDEPVPGLRKSGLTELEHAVIRRFNPDRDPDHVRNDDRLIDTFYHQLAKKELLERCDYWSAQLPFRPARISIRNQRTKWGSCSARGTISLNWRLVKCPPDIIDYIIIHELCHLRHFNHSKAFWEAVRHCYPGVREARAWIREHSDEIFADF